MVSVQNLAARPVFVKLGVSWLADHVSTEAEPLLEHSSQRVQDAEPVYSNVGIGLQSVPPIKVEDLWDYIRNNKSNDMEGLRREYRVRVSNVDLIYW